MDNNGIDRAFYEAILKFESDEKSREYYYSVMDSKTGKKNKDGREETVRDRVLKVYGLLFCEDTGLGMGMPAGVDEVYDTADRLYIGSVGYDREHWYRMKHHFPVIDDDNYDRFAALVIADLHSGYLHEAAEKEGKMLVVGEADPDSEILEFEDPLQALAYAREKSVDAAFLDTDMQNLSGVELGQYLKELNPFINLIFLSEDEGCCFDALDMHASGYIIKPPEDENIKRELSELRYPEFQKEHKRVFAQTFGNFELFVDGSPVDFKYRRTKEIVALLVNNRGAQTTNGEIMASLWEDEGDPEKKVSYLSNLRQDLQNTFKDLKLDGIIIKQRGSMAIAKDRIECDLYDYLEKRCRSKYTYTGEYMKQYAWSEYSMAELDEISFE